MLSSFYPLAKKALFSLDPESAHHVSIEALRQLEKYQLLGPLSGPFPTAPVRCMGLDFPNPVGLAAGMDKQGHAVDAFGQLGFGFVEIGTLTPQPQVGNPKPRLFRLPEYEALINRMGFNNPGVQQGVQNVRASKRYQGIVGINIGKNKLTPNEDALSDYLTALRECYGAADYIAVNLSSPNTPGLRELQNEEEAARLLSALRAEQSRLAQEHGKRVPIAFKVAPDLEESHIAGLARVFREEGLEGLIATNTTLARSQVTGHRHASEAGGLSGAPVADLATRVISQFSQLLGPKIPIIGVGGIVSGEGAAEKFAAGAQLVQLYSGFVYRGPKLIEDCVEAYLARPQ